LNDKLKSILRGIADVSAVCNSPEYALQFIIQSGTPEDLRVVVKDGLLISPNRRPHVFLPLGV